MEGRFRLNKKEVEQQVIDSYQSDEKMMILVYAQWCINHDLDPEQLYKEAYPEQMINPLLEEALKLTVPKEESQLISEQTVIQALQLFGNHDLAFIVQREIEQIKKDDA